jgi:hypothetical protein
MVLEIFTQASGNILLSSGIARTSFHADAPSSCQPPFHNAQYHKNSAIASVFGFFFSQSAKVFQARSA